MNCTVEQRNKARRVFQQMGGQSDVIGTDLVSSAIDSSGRWRIEFALDADGLPPEIVLLLGKAEMTIGGAAAVVVALHRCCLTGDFFF